MMSGMDYCRMPLHQRRLVNAEELLVEKIVVCGITDPDALDDLIKHLSHKVVRDSDYPDDPYQAHKERPMIRNALWRTAVRIKEAK